MYMFWYMYMHINLYGSMPGIDCCLIQIAMLLRI